MSGEEIVAPSQPFKAASEPEPYSEAWWHERSAEELRLIMDKGFRLGPAFEGATAEAERRARERLREEEQAEAAKEVRNKQIRRLILEVLLFASLLVVIAVAVTR
jgi:hypothetical protein